MQVCAVRGRVRGNFRGNPRGNTRGNSRGSFRGCEEALKDSKKIQWQHGHDVGKGDISPLVAGQMHLHYIAVIARKQTHIIPMTDAENK